MSNMKIPKYPDKSGATGQAKTIFFIGVATCLAVVLIAVLIFSSSENVINAAGEVALYSFNEGTGTTLVDSSGNSRNGTLINGPTWTTGKYSNALSFDGTNDYVSVSSFGLGSSDFTLSVWINPVSISGTRTILWKGVSSDTQYYLLLNNNGQVQCGHASAGNFYWLNSASSVGINQWTHIACTYNNADRSVVVYINGSQNISGSFSVSPVVNNNPLILGNDPNYNEYFAGSIDEVRIYNRALSQFEIQTDMNTPIGGTPPPPPTPDTQAPTTPTNLSATAISSSQINLSWAASTDNIGVAGYRIYRGGSQIATVTTNSHSNTGLSPSTLYSYSVSAYDAAGNSSSQSSSVSATTQAVSSANPIDSMQPGTWYEVSNSRIADIKASSGQFPWVAQGEGVSGIINDWCSGAFDIVRNRLYIGPCGGHNGYYGNEVYAFDVDDLKWYRITDPKPVSGECPTDSNQPCAIHTYDGLEYLPPPVDRFVQVGGWSGTGTFSLNLSTNTWEKFADPGQGRTGDIAAWDPNTGSLWFHSALYAGTDSLMQWNPSTGAWTKRNNLNGFSGDSLTYYMTATFDAKRNKLVAVGGGRVLTWDTISGTSAIPGQQISTTGDTAMVNENNPGLEYDPVSDRIVAWDGGTNVYTLNLDTRVWTKISPSVANTVIPTAANQNGTYGRWRYVPSKNVFIAVNNVNENVYIYKPNFGTIPLADTQAPSVSMTAPTSGSTVSGSLVTVSANASDNVGAVGVQFKLDGVNLGAEDTTSPYSITWNTTQTANGSHILTVTARDAAGNQTTSSGITVTVNNVIPPSQNLSFTRVTVDSAFSGDVKAVGDIDGDGFSDIILGGMQMSWYKYPAWTKNTIASANVEFTTDMQVADIDGDGDLDIVVADGSGTNNVIWLENPRPAGNPSSAWTRRIIGTHGDWGHDIEVADFDRDGKLDVVTRKNYTNIFFQNTLTSWTKRDISSVVGSGEGVGIGDIDRDGDFDLVAAGAWIESPSAPRTGTWTKRTISSGWGSDTTAVIGDINGDGRPDAVLANQHARSKLAWYEGPVDPKTGTWTERLIDSSMGSHKLNLGDLNNDGRLDVVAGLELQELSIYLNQGGIAPAFAKQVISTSGIHNQRLGDIGNDGDLDIIGANYLGYPPGEFWQNNLVTGTGGLPLNKWMYKQVSSSHAQTFGLAFGDVNSDGLKDIISGPYWYRNPGGNMLSTWTAGNFPSGMHAILSMDIDGDIFLDVIAQKNEGDLAVYWLEPTDTSYSLWNSVKIGLVPAASHSLGVQGYRTAQIEAGGKEEVVITSGSGIYYFRVPSLPSSGNWPRVQVNVNPSDEGLAIGDIDRDGYLDIAATTGDTKRVEWYRNPGNGASGWAAYAIGNFSEAVYPDRTELADINKDGRLDIVVSEENGVSSGAETYWWQQPSSATSQNWTRSLIASQGTTNSMDVADMDKDGDIDVVLAEHRGGLKVAIWANNGSGGLTENIVSTGKESHLGARVSDLDGDGDLDIISIAYDAPQNLHLWRNDAILGNATPGDTTPPASPIGVIVI